MTNWKHRATELLSEFDACCRARPKHGVIDIQLEKDSVAKFAYHLSTQRSWGTDNEIAEACYQLEPRLRKLKEKLVMEILNHGSI